MESIANIIPKITRDWKKNDAEAKAGWAKLQEEKRLSQISMYIHRSGINPSCASIKLSELQMSTKNKAIHLYNTTGKLPYLYGPNGSGKTVLSRVVGLEIMRAQAVQVYMSNMASKLIGFNLRQLEEECIDMTVSSVLIMDDLFNHRLTQSVAEIIYHVLNKRCDEAKPTLITSNIPPDKILLSLEQVSSNNNVSRNIIKAIQDRIIGLCPLMKLDGESYRFKQAKEERV